jgi:hypothetical protein
MGQIPVPLESLKMTGMAVAAGHPPNDKALAIEVIHRDC